MSTAPSLSALRSSKQSGGGGGGADPAWTSALSGNSCGPGPGSSPAGCTKPFVHAVPPSDPLRQANRLPIKVLKMLTSRTGHILHPEYLQPLPSTPVSPIELDAKKSPLALLAQTCSQIGKPDPSPSSKLSSVASNGGGAGGAGGAGSDKDGKSGPLKLSDIPGTLALRSPHHALGLSSRYHPYSKSPLPTPGAPVPVPAATGPYYSPYALYGQRLTTASALGYQ
ncbi:PREDICTED: zinc finger protein 503 [Myotis davidii]|uniref:zinc finger protein 503 n=1 Tax=Myotis davidii TaxID=225400 RepID=UPI00076739FA|nr:PREDICTED: zinc finger protein 503 [Myotis davidii]